MDKKLKLFREKTIELFLSDLDSFKKMHSYLDEDEQGSIFKLEKNNFNYYYIDSKRNKDKNAQCTTCSVQEFKDNYLKTINFDNIFNNDKLSFHYDSKHKNIFNFASKIGDAKFYNYIFANFVTNYYLNTHKIKPGFNIDFFETINKTNESKAIFKSFLNFIINEIDLVDNQQLTYKENTYHIYRGLRYNQIDDEDEAIFIKNFLSYLQLDVLNPKDKEANDFLKSRITSKYLHLFKEKDETTQLFNPKIENIEIDNFSFNSYIFRDKYIALIDLLSYIISSTVNKININANEININKLEFFNRKNSDDSFEIILFLHKEKGTKELFPLDKFIVDTFDYINTNINEKDLSSNSYNGQDNIINKHIEKFLEQYILKHHLSNFNNNSKTKNKLKL